MPVSDNCKWHTNNNIIVRLGLIFFIIRFFLPLNGDLSVFFDSKLADLNTEFNLISKNWFETFCQTVKPTLDSTPVSGTECKSVIPKKLNKCIKISVNTLTAQPLYIIFPKSIFKNIV